MTDSNVFQLIKGCLQKVIFTFPNVSGLLRTCKCFAQQKNKIIKIYYFSCLQSCCRDRE